MFGYVGFTYYILIMYYFFKKVVAIVKRKSAWINNLVNFRHPVNNLFYAEKKRS